LKGDYTLFTYKNTDRRVVTRVFAPEQSILLNHPHLTLVAPWELYTLSDQIDVKAITPEPPQTLRINIDSIRNNDFPQQWPTPIINHSNSFYSREQFYLAHLDTSGNLLFIKIDSLLVLIIKNNLIIDEKTISTLFERIDLIIICTDSTHYAESIRRQLRPRLCISTSPPAVDCAQQSNLTFTSKHECSIECCVSGKKSIKISKIR
jgi:hypothetical protein